MVSNETLKAKLAFVRQQRDNLIANANACSGAIQLLEDLLENSGADIPEVKNAPIVIDPPTHIEVG